MNIAKEDCPFNCPSSFVFISEVMEQAHPLFGTLQTSYRSERRDFVFTIVSRPETLRNSQILTFLLIPIEQQVLSQSIPSLRLMWRKYQE